MVDGKWNKFRDDVTHDGRQIDWGKWAITGNDPVFGGTGNPDTGEYSTAAQQCIHVIAISFVKAQAIQAQLSSEQLLSSAFTCCMVLLQCQHVRGASQFGAGGAAQLQGCGRFAVRALHRFTWLCRVFSAECSI